MIQDVDTKRYRLTDVSTQVRNGFSSKGEKEKTVGDQIKTSSGVPVWPSADVRVSSGGLPFVIGHPGAPVRNAWTSRGYPGRLSRGRLLGQSGAHDPNPTLEAVPDRWSLGPCP